MFLNTLKQRLMGDYISDPRHDINLFNILVRDSFIPLTLILGASFTAMIFTLRSFAGINIPLGIFIPYIFIFPLLYIAYIKYPRQKLFRSVIFVIILATFLLVVTSKNEPLNEFAIILLFPVLAYNLAGHKTGSLWILFFSISVLTIVLLAGTDIIQSQYNTATLLTGFSIFVYIAILSYYAELRHGTIEKLLMRQLYYDNTTDLPNRKMLMEDIPLTLYPSLIIIRIDNFHDINTFFGYNLGDAILKFISERISQYRTDYKLKIYNLTGGEFAVIVNMGNTSPKENSAISVIAGELLKHISEKEFIHKEIKIPLTAYAGIAPSSGGSLNLISKADIALHHAKRNRMPIHIFHENDRDKAIYLNNIKNFSLLNEAVSENRLVPFYQPIMNNITGCIHKYESLLRIIDKSGIPMLPDPFLNVSKKTRIYPEITKIIFEKTFAYMDNKNLDFALNISAEDIYHPGFFKFIQGMTEKFPSTQGRVILEIVESENFTDYRFLGDFIKTAKKTGLLFAIDDFGTGYSNFSYLSRLHLDFIKFDGSLISKIDSDRNSRIIVQNIAALCKELGIKTIAEFVSNEDILNQVKDYGIDYSQGFHIGVPVPFIMQHVPVQ